MVELTIGSRFYYKDKLCEVVEEDCNGINCVLNGNVRECNKSKCHASERHDGKYVCFKEVENLTPPNKGPALCAKKRSNHIYKGVKE